MIAKIISSLLTFASGVFCYVAGSSLAFADDYQPYQAPVTNNDLSVPLFVSIAYGAIWLLLLWFVFHIYSKQRELKASIEDLQRKIDKAQTPT